MRASGVSLLQYPDDSVGARNRFLFYLSQTNTCVKSNGINWMPVEGRATRDRFAIVETTGGETKHGDNYFQSAIFHFLSLWNGAPESVFLVFQMNSKAFFNLFLSFSLTASRFCFYLTIRFRFYFIFKAHFNFAFNFNSHFSSCLKLNYNFGASTKNHIWKGNWFLQNELAPQIWQSIDNFFSNSKPETLWMNCKKICASTKNSILSEFDIQLNIFFRFIKEISRTLNVLVTVRIISKILAPPPKIIWKLS